MGHCQCFRHNLLYGTPAEIADAFVRQDYLLADDVAPVSEETTRQIRNSIEDQGGKVVALPQEALIPPSASGWKTTGTHLVIGGRKRK